MLQLPRKSVLSALVLLVGLGLSLGAAAETVDWSEYMEPRGAAPPSTGPGQPAKASRPAKRGKVAKRSKAKTKRRAAARKGKGRR
jgi:hypothetical protein